MIAVKLHRGRPTDTRDVVALIDDADMKHVEAHLDRGNRDKHHQMLENISETVSDSDLEDSFKGVFSQGNLPETQIQKLKEFIQNRS